MSLVLYLCLEIDRDMNRSYKNTLEIHKSNFYVAPYCSQRTTHELLLQSTTNGHNPIDVLDSLVLQVAIKHGVQVPARPILSNHVVRPVLPIKTSLTKP